MIRFIKRYSLYFAWVVALIATMGSLYFSQILNVKPCVFCWYQRIFMFPLAIILGIAVYKKDIKIFPYVIALPLIGAFIALGQTFFSYFNITSLVCGLDCVDANSKLFGFLELSVASFGSFMVIAFLLFIAKK